MLAISSCVSSEEQVTGAAETVQALNQRWRHQLMARRMGMLRWMLDPATLSLLLATQATT